MVSKFQHHVIYVKDLPTSKDFYMQLFDLQFSALNHPDSSAAMKLSQQEMHFFSFGYYHHDICLVKHHRLEMDNDSMLHYSVVVKEKEAYEKILDNAAKMKIPFRKGRMLASAQWREGWEAICLQDPSGHWIEIISK